MTQQEIERLFKKHYLQMYRLAASFLYDEDESKDVVSEVFSRLIASGVDLRPETAEAYLLAGVRNQCRNVLEGKQVRERFLRLFSEDVAEATAAESERLQMTELMRYIEEHLSERSQQIFRLRYLCEMTCQEVADALGVSRITVHNHLRESIENIRAFFKSIR
ncbi:MAG: sigma-70 family RNA polymerase sigma factor [Bacteroidaceae bacterium]|nr:sigma-70 family RNA polymerase sigma factor [Bacteroidaceae bacterium]